MTIPQITDKPNIEHVSGKVTRKDAMGWAMDCTDNTLTTRTIVEYVAFMLGVGGVSETLFLFHKGQRFNIKIQVSKVDDKE